jgi:hypothetical protein
MTTKYRIERIKFDGPYMRFNANGRPYRVRNDQLSMRLARAEQSDRENIRFSPAGYTVFWPKLNFEMTISGLMQMASPAF